MEALLAPRYYRHIHPTLGTGFARIQDGAGPFVILATEKVLYSAPRKDVEEITREEYESSNTFSVLKDLFDRTTA